MAGCIVLAALRLVTVDPGHFHAALVQKWTYPEVSAEVQVFAPDGEELAAHLKMIDGFNARSENPTCWKENVVRDGNPLAVFSRWAASVPDPSNSVVVLAGRNDRKADYALAAVKAGMNVLADKPLAIDATGLEKLEEAVEIARKRRLAFMDLMTDRTDVHTRLTAALLREKEVFGDFRPSSPVNPAVVCESSHHFLKTVNGSELRRPSWYYDVARQGEGIVDVTTHVLDAIQRAVCPETELGRNDVRICSARTWTTPVTIEDYRESTGYSEWPTALRSAVDARNVLQCMANGNFTCSLRGVHAKVGVMWNVRDTVGDGDVFAATYYGTKCWLRVMPDSGHGTDMAVFIRLYDWLDRGRLAPAVEAAMPRLRKVVPGLRAACDRDGWRLDVPVESVVAHDPSFAAFTRVFLGWAANHDEPAKEYANLLVKYRTLVSAREMAHAKSARPKPHAGKVIPTPVSLDLTGEEVELSGFALSGEYPAYVRESAAELLAGTFPLAFVRVPSLGAQAYELTAVRDGVRVRAGDAAGAIYAVSTLKQLMRKIEGGRWTLALGEVRDKPGFPTRGINWNMFVEARSWSMDDGKGIEDFKRRFIAGLDTMAFFKLNAVIVDGIGWNPERFPGYGALMRSLADEARKRAIKLGYIGYSEGYGAQWLETDGPKFRNERDGKPYPCFGLGDAGQQREAGTCLADEVLMDAKKENLKAFVKAVEPGFIYVHGADINEMKEMVEGWSNRCERCRARWPNEDTCAPDGAAGAFAFLYDELKEAVSSVRNPETGYDASRDLEFIAIAPNYTTVREDDKEWNYHLRYFTGLSTALRNRDMTLMLREQYVTERGEPRCRQLRNAVGDRARLGVIVFCAGDGYLNCTPATGEMALTKYFCGCDTVIAAGGNAFGEPRQAMWAEYEWNPEGTGYPWDPGLQNPAETYAAYRGLSEGSILPEPIFRHGDGLLHVACAKLYGELAGPAVADMMTSGKLGIPGYDDSVALIMPLASERLPGTRFSRFRFRRGKRELRWREDLDDADMRSIRRELAIERACISKTRAAAAVFRGIAPKTKRTESLLRMARVCETGAELGDLTAEWLETLLKFHAYRQGDGYLSEVVAGVDRLTREADRQLARFEVEKGKMLDASGGLARDGWMSAEYLRKEADNMRSTLERNVFPPHPIRSWW